MVLGHGGERPGAGRKKAPDGVIKRKHLSTTVKPETDAWLWEQRRKHWGYSQGKIVDALVEQFGERLVLKVGGWKKDK